MDKPIPYTADQVEDINATLEGLIDRIAASWEPVDDMTPLDGLGSSFDYLVGKMIGLVGSRMVAICGRSECDNIAINMALLLVTNAGDMVGHMSVQHRIPGMIMAVQKLSEVAQNPRSGD